MAASLQSLNSLVETVVEKLKIAKESLRDARTPGETSARTGVSSKSLEAALKEETRARKAATRQLEIEVAERRAMLTEERAQAKVNALRLNSEAAIMREEARQRNLFGRSPAPSFGVGMADFYSPTVNGPAVSMEDFGLSSGGPGSFQARKLSIAERMQSRWAGSRVHGLLTRLGMDNTAGGASALRRFAPLAAPFIVKAGMDQMTSMGNIAQNEDLSWSERSRSMRESIPGIGGFLKSIRHFGEMLDGTSEKLRTLNDRYQRQVLNYDLGASRRGREADIENPAILAGARVDAIHKYAYPELQKFDRNTLVGERNYQIYNRHVRPVQQRIVDAARAEHEGRTAAMIAASRQQESQRLWGLARADNLSARNELARLEREGGTHAQLQEARRRVRASDQAIMTSGGNFISDATASNNAARREAELRSESRLAQTLSPLHAKREALEEQLERTQTAAGRFGAAGPVGRMQFDVARQMAERMGFDNLPMQMQETIARFAPEYANQQWQRIGDASPEFRAGQRAGFFGNDTQSLADLRNKIGKVDQNIRIVIETDQAQLAREIAAAVSPNVQAMIEAVRAEVESRLREMQAGQQAGNQAAVQ